MTMLPQMTSTMTMLPPDDFNYIGSRRDISGDKKDSALWLKYVDPDENEGERFERYAECLQLAS